MPALHPPSTPQPKINLSRLRDIGWSKWGPIGLLNDEQTWGDADCLSFADEYDTYLLQAAGQLRRGISEEDVVRYLVNIETNHMGLGPADGVIARAEEVVAAIQADKELRTCSD